MKARVESLFARRLGFQTTVDPIHDTGLFVFEGAWVALGVALLRADRRGRPDTASALV